MASESEHILSAFLETTLDAAGDHLGAIGLVACFYYGALLEYLNRFHFFNFEWPKLGLVFALATAWFLLLLLVLYFALEKAIGPLLSRVLAKVSDKRRRDNWEGGLGFAAGALIIIVFGVSFMRFWTAFYDVPLPVASAEVKNHVDPITEPPNEVHSPPRQLMPSLGPSFDCAKATYRSERLVCSSPELAMLDRAMANAYRDAAARVGTRSRKAALRDLQNHWLRRVREACPEVDCLIGAYEKRVSELNAIQR